MPMIRRTCGRCNGKGGWTGWPGYYCFDCGGQGYKLVDATTEERRLIAALKRTAKLSTQREAIQAANLAKSEIVFEALRAYYAKDEDVMAKVQTFDSHNTDNYLVDVFRGQMARRCGTQVPHSLPALADTIHKHLEQLSEHRS